MSVQPRFVVCDAIVRRQGATEADLYLVTHWRKGRLILEAPQNSLHQALPNAGEELMVEMYLPDAAYRLVGSVVACLEGKPIALLLKQEGDVERVQRREHVRVKVSMRVKTFDPEATSQPVELITRDPSAGGFGANSPVPFTESAKHGRSRRRGYRLLPPAHTPQA